jgi:plastocyanin
MRRWLGLVVVAVVVMLLGAACSSSSNGSSSDEGGGQITINGDKANDHGTKAVSGNSFDLEADDFYFDPTTLTGTAGQTVKIEIENEGSTEHNFSIDDQNIDQDIEDGKTATVTVKFPASGVVEFYCKYHKTSGMVGQLKAS